MWGLIYKDLCANKKPLLISLFGTLFFAVIMTLFMVVGTDGCNDEEDIIVISIIAGMECLFIYLCWIDTAASFIAVDERKEWVNFAVSSPASIKGQVQSKYAEGIITIIFVVNIEHFILLVADMVFYKANGGIELNAISNINAVILFAWMLLILWAVEIPFLIYFGKKHGGYIKLGLLMAVFTALVINLLYGSGNISFDKFFRMIFSHEIRRKMQIFVAVLPCAASLLYYLSYRLSCRLYLKGVEKNG